MKNITIAPIQAEDFSDLILLVGDLLNEIMTKINLHAFHFDPEKTLIIAKDLISNEKYWVFMAKDIVSGKNIGFISLYESFALYSEGAYGTIPELFISQKYRSNKIGNALVNEAIKFAKGKNWSRLEVTTPPLPQFDKTLNFYQVNGFEITGGRKLKIEIKHTTNHSSGLAEARH
ncbi:GNAT family N-acetyltransferase [Desulfogranum japonicum]|uniref:GNAT family N-acetyltransferase n=1 Tax=Desulfogranum japonicum TaxID=231447 RepID=UPI0004048913|nr:GNAT family N-acetyltransferase [Desulfogranum japonicum]